MLSYTALLGMHVLRVPRDDEWCALMLQVSHSIYRRFVLDPEAFVKQDVLFGTCVRSTSPQGSLACVPMVRNAIVATHSRADADDLLCFAGEKQYMSFLRKTSRLTRAGKVESLVPTPATPINLAAGDALFL